MSVSVRPLLAALSVLGLTACHALRPMPLHEPPRIGQAVTTEPGLGYPRTIHCRPNGPTCATDILYGYINAYSEKADELYTLHVAQAEAALGGGVIGTVAGAFERRRLAILGGLLAGGSATMSQRYAGLVQASNYSGAAAALTCMADVVAYAGSDAEIDFPVLNQHITAVRKKLRHNQSSIDIAKADTQALEEAIRKFLEKESNAKPEEQALQAAEAELAALREQIEEAERELAFLRADFAEANQVANDANVAAKDAESKFQQLQNGQTAAGQKASPLNSTEALVGSAQSAQVTMASAQLSATRKAAARASGLAASAGARVDAQATRVNSLLDRKESAEDALRTARATAAEALRAANSVAFEKCAAAY